MQIGGNGELKEYMQGGSETSLKQDCDKSHQALLDSMEDDEFSTEINDLSFSIYSWAFRNFEIGRIDTVSSSELSTSTITNLGGEDFFMYGSDQMTKIELTLTDIRIMDAYHLIESMMDTRSARSILKENTMFFENAAGKVNRIKIAGGQVQIKLLSNGKVKIISQSNHLGC